MQLIPHNRERGVDDSGLTHLVLRVRYDIVEVHDELVAE
jgi:hypothetical protein